MLLARWIVGRITSAALTLVGVSLIVFLALHLVPGRFEDLILGPFGSPEARARVAERYGLDRPLPEQYLRWAGAAVTGDLGTSLTTRNSIGDEFARRAPVTIQLAGMATAMALLVGIPLGILGALASRRRFVRGGMRLVGALAISVPDFVLGSVFVYVFSRFALGPTIGGYVPFAQDPLTNLRAMILPAVVLGIFGVALVLRTTRDAVLGVLSEPFITTAVANGEVPGTIVRRHVLRNAAIPVLTVVATYTAYLLGGAVVVEKLFVLPGFGAYVFTAIGNRDYGVVQAGVLVAATVFVTINMLADIAYRVVDPRVGALRVARAT